MYEERLGTDWVDLSEAEAIDRAFALGVASAFGYENREEFDRLRGALDSSYDRSIIDLAHQEGKQKALRLQGEVPDRTALWDRLVGTDDLSDRGSASGARPPDPEGAPGNELPESLHRPENLARAGLLEGGKDLGALQYPRFLRKRAADDEDDRS